MSGPAAPPPPAPHTPGSLQALQARYGERYRWRLLLSVMLGAMAALVSSTVVNVAIPDLSHHFGLGQDAARWVTSGFMAASVVAMLTTPWMLARFGFRRTYVLCMAALIAGGVLGGVADHYALVLGARLAEGVAAGIVQPIPAIVILRAFRPDEHGRASGLFGMGVVLAPALGPSLGGLLVDAWGWRAIFFLVVPFGLVSWALARRYVPVTAPGGVPARSGLALAGVLLAAFVAWQRRRARRGRPQPLMHPGVFGHRAFAGGSVVSLIYGAALFGSTYLFPVYLQLGLGLSAAWVGALLLPVGLVLALTIAVVGRLADRQPAHRLVAVGLALLTLSFVAFALVPAGAPLAPLAPLVALAVLGRIGLGFVLPSLNLGAMRGLPAAQLPHGSSAIGVLRMLGGAAMVSVCGVFLEWRLAAHGVAGIGPGTPADAAALAATAPARLGAFADTFGLLAAVCALALLSARALRPPRHVEGRR